MRNWIAVLLMLAACKNGSKTGTVIAQITGGDTIIGAAYDSVCALYVVLPPDEMQDPQDPIYCAGTQVAPGILLTAASCVEENLTANTVADIEVRCGPNANELFAVTEVKLHRYYARLTGSVDDLALVQLDGLPSGPVAAINERGLVSGDLGPSDPESCSEANGGLAVNGCAALIGYGETANGADDPGARFGVNLPVRSVETRHVLAGTLTQTGCKGDTGAPLFMDLGAGPVLVAVTSSNKNSCFNNTLRTRVDVYLDDFIYPYLDRSGVTCGLDDICEASGCPRSVDPDCDACAWNETCEEDCPTRDWDCPLGSFIGDDCEDSGDCERGGRCLTAHDDGAFLYCSQPCDPDQEGSCSAGMLCGDIGGSGDECSWDPALPSPGSQGADCATGLDCRSAICEETYCVVECDPGAADPCPENLADPDQPYTCQPSTVQSGTNVCIGQVFSGGGGFCSTGGRTGGRTGGWPAWLLLAAALLLTRRRR